MQQNSIYSLTICQNLWLFLRREKKCPQTKIQAGISRLKM